MKPVLDRELVGEPSPDDALAITPPGERYYRHPGDALRLVLWGVATVLLLVLVEVAEATTEGITTDFGHAGERVAAAIRELSLALLQVGALVVPAAVIGGS
jgi:hypothetical protein